MASHLFKFPINYVYGHQSFSLGSGSPPTRTGASQISDNDYRTFSSQTRFAIETHGDSSTDNTRITHIFIKAKNLTNYTVSVPSGEGSGTGLTDQTIPANQVVDGIQHDLRSLGPLNATEVEVSVTGTSTEVYEIMLLESVLEIPDIYVEIQPTRGDRGAIKRTNIRGELYTVPGLSGRYKWLVRLAAVFVPPPNPPPNPLPPTAEDLLRALEENHNLTFAEDFDRFPERVYPATLANSIIGIDYVGRLFEQKRIKFSIAEI